MFFKIYSVQLSETLVNLIKFTVFVRISCVHPAKTQLLNLQPFYLVLTNLCQQLG